MRPLYIIPLLVLISCAPSRRIHSPTDTHTEPAPARVTAPPARSTAPSTRSASDKKPAASPWVALKVNKGGTVTTADGAMVRYLRRGQGTGAPAYLVLEQGYYVLPFMRVLEATGDVIYVWGATVEGKGSKPRVEGQVDETLVSDIEALRAALGLARITIIGNSHRGLAALEYTRAHPARVVKAVLVNPLIHHPGHLREAYSRVIGMLQTSKGAKSTATRREIAHLKRLLKKKRYDLVDFFRAFEARTLYNKHVNILGYYAFLGRLRSLMPTAGVPGSRPAPHDVKARVAAMVRKGIGGTDVINYSSLTFAQTVTTPVCILQGEGDPLTTVRWARALAAKLPKGSLKTIPAAGHNPSFENPAAFTMALLGCLGITGKGRVGPLLPATWQPALFKRMPDREALRKKLTAHYEMAMRPRGMVSVACRFARAHRRDRALLKKLGTTPAAVGQFVDQTCRRFPPPDKR